MYLGRLIGEVNLGRSIWADYWADTFGEANLGRLIWGDLLIRYGEIYMGRWTRRNVVIPLLQEIPDINN